jgi:hypothetical protein
MSLRLHGFVAGVAPRALFHSAGDVASTFDPALSSF